MASPVAVSWSSRLAALLLSAAAAGCAVFWFQQLQALRLQAPLVAVERAASPSVDVAAVARALGASPEAATAPVPAVEASVSSRLVLVGIVAAPGGGGAALIGVDGKPAKPFVVGSTVADAWVLRKVQRRGATLAQGGVEVLLELPPQADLVLQK